MKKLKHKTEEEKEETWLTYCLTKSNSLEEFLQLVTDKLSKMNINFYIHIGELLTIIGFNTRVSRDGDVNCRFDATIIDSQYSIPIEIKSPGETREINVKSIRQALENKIVLLSRQFYNTEKETTSLVIAQYYPQSRSDINELIDDIKKVWGFNIGIISLESLLVLAYEVRKNGHSINKTYFNQLKGKLDNEKAFN